MPLSGHEETGVKSYAGQFSDLIAGVPIKKRRFPLIQTFSPLSEEKCSVTEETELLRKEHSSTPQGSTLSNASIADAPIKKRRFPLLQASSSQSEEPSSPTEENDALRKENSSTSQGSTLLTSSSGLSDTNKNPAFEERKENSDVTDANVVRSNVNYLSTDLSLSLKEHLLPAVESLGIHESCQNVEKAEPVSLKLSLSKEECCMHNLNGDTKTNSGTACIHSNRENWDLNTTMDVWQESGSDATLGKTSLDGLKISGGTPNEKHFMCSPALLTTGVAPLNQNHAESQNIAFTISSRLYDQQCKCVDPCNLCLTSSDIQKYAEEPSTISVNKNSGNDIRTVSLSSGVSSASVVDVASFRMVKSEQLDENLNQDLKEGNPCCGGSLDSVTIKHELVECANVESFKSSTGNNLKTLDPKLIKSEPCHKINLERPKTTESKSDQFGAELSQGSDNCYSAKAKPICSEETVPVSAETVYPPVKHTCSAELSTSGSIVNHLENCASTEGPCADDKVWQGICSSAKQAPLEAVTIATVDNVTESSCPGTNDSTGTKEENVDDPEGCRLKLMNDLPSDPRGSGEGCVSDDEKITLSADMLEDDCYGFDYESDGTHSLTVAMDIEQYSKEDDDYEDGEVREPLEHSPAEDTICEVGEVECLDCSSYENKEMEKGVFSGDCPGSSHVEEIDNKTVSCSEINSGKDGLGTELNEKSGKLTDRNLCHKESLDPGQPTVNSDANAPLKALQGKSLDIPERKIIPKGMETELLSNQATNGSQGIDVAQSVDEVVKKPDVVRIIDPDFPKVEASANIDDATKDVINGGNQGRIINLSRAAGASSPSKTRSILGMELPAQAGRDILSDALDGDKLPRGRDEVYIDGPRRFWRERNQDMPPRNSRLNFVRGRGRFSSRLGTLRGEWESAHQFSGEFYNGPSQFRTPRHKYASVIPDAELEYNNVESDGSYVGTGRVGRKDLNEEGPLCRHIASRRRSPRGRESIQMGHRIPRTMRSSRCVGGDGSELVGMRHSEKFRRGFHEDPLDPMFTRPQTFEGLDGRFTQGSRNFSTIQRRGLPQIHSKSPIRSRSRSPSPWSSPRRRSPRRRSPDGFDGHPELGHQRSPLYRVDRMRSPERHVFRRERVVRRHVSPPYMSRPSNDIRDIDSGRGRGHPRSVISNRSPSDRVLLRNRRFDVVDPRDEADNDEYFGGPMHSGQLLELNGEGNGDERRRFRERRGPIRSFRPPYSGTVVENFHLDTQDGPRHYRFCTDDSDFHERGSLRERNFDKRIKSGPANVPPRRTGNIDEQESNYRHGGQVWSDDGYDGVSRVKRKRF